MKLSGSIHYLYFEFLRKFLFIAQIWSDVTMIGLLGCWAGGNTISPAQMSSTPQIRHWVFTSFEAIWPAWIPDIMNYLVYQIEVAPDTGRFHIQGYCEFKRSVRLNRAKKALALPTAHFEPRQGSRAQARAYCMKEESRSPHEDAGPWEFGEWAEGEVKRSDLETVIGDMRSGKDFNTIVLENPAVALRYYKNLNLVWTHFNTKARDGTTPTVNLYIYGDAGVGKTRFSNWLRTRQASSPYTSYISKGQWWQNYMGHSWAIYDDFDGAVHMDVGDFKKICDRYEFTVQNKGGSAQYCAEYNIFTSNTYPIDWYERVHWDAVKRRGNHRIWWRVNSIQCEACEDLSQGQVEPVVCPVLQLIAEAKEEWAVLDLFNPVN